MTFAQLLTELSRHNIGITITSDSIKTNVPASQIPDHIKEVLRLNKAEIIAIMGKPLKSFDNADNLVDAAIALGGEVKTVIYEDGTVAVQGLGEEIPF